MRGRRSCVALFSLPAAPSGGGLSWGGGLACPDAPFTSILQFLFLFAPSPFMTPGLPLTPQLPFLGTSYTMASRSFMLLHAR